MKFKTYRRVESLDEAYQLLQEDRKNMVVAGGGWLKMSSRTLETAIDLSALGLDRIVAGEDTIEIGSMTPLSAIEADSGIAALASGILSQAAGAVMGLSFRNLATVGGSVVGKYGFSDVLTPLLAMGAELDFYGEGRISLEAFLKKKGRTADILKSVIVPRSLGPGYFKKVRKTRLDFAALNLAVVTTQRGYRIAVGSRPSAATLGEEAMEILNSADTIDEATIEKAARAVASLKYGDNPRASKTYREHVAYVYTKRAIEEVRDCED